MFVSIYKTIARFSPLDFTIGHGGMFTIRQRPLCRYYSTVFYFFIVLHGNATGKLIRFSLEILRVYFVVFVLFCFVFCMNNILNIFLPLDHGGEGVYWLTNKYFCWLDCLRPVQGHKYRHSTRSNFAGFWTFFNIIFSPKHLLCNTLKKNTDIPVFCTVYKLNFFQPFVSKCMLCNLFFLKRLFLKKTLSWKGWQI